MRQINDGESLVMGRVEVDGGRNTHLPSLFPTRSAKAPFVAGFKSRKPKLGSRGDQVISAVITILQELSRDGHAHCVHALVHWAGIAATITEKAGERIVTTILQLTAKNVTRFGLCFTHAGDIASGLFAADFKTRQ